MNRAFYAGFSDDFARTRRTWPLGYGRILPYLRAAANVLDVGCGNGRLLAFLVSEGWQGAYLGVDGSAGLLAAARQIAAAHPQAQARFFEADLFAVDWPARTCAAALAPFGESVGQPREGGAWRAEALACLAVLQHIPGVVNRVRFLVQCATLLAPQARMIVSTWQFMTSERLRRRLLSWETVGLRAAAVEPGDHLVAWGAGAAGQRYCAFIDQAALAGLAEAAGLAVADTFFADGQEGNLNLYAVLTAR